MTRFLGVMLPSLAVLAFTASAAQAEILAMVNYDSKPGQSVERDGIAVLDVDPDSPNFGKILVDVPLPHGMHNHHIFYNKDATKAYITGPGKNLLLVMDLTQFPYRVETIPAADCRVGEDLVFSDDNSKWYLTCMGSSTVVFGDAGTRHFAFTKDGRYAIVQNNLLGLDGMNDGSITVIDLETETVATTLTTFKDQGLNPNLIVLLPRVERPSRPPVLPYGIIDPIGRPSEVSG